MATCKECIHYELCKDTWADENWNDDTPQIVKDMYSPKGCANFKNKSNFVEVVRCKDCKHRGEQYYHGSAICNEHNITIDCDDFCSFGERKDT